MLTLRPYQNEAIEEGLFGWFAKNPTGNPLIAMPTGTGKSLILGEFVRRALSLYPQTRIMIATHVQELVEQDHEELLRIWPTAPCGIYSAGLSRRDNHLPITFVSIQSVAKRMEEFGHIDLLIVDEAHLISHRESTTYQNAIASLKITNPTLRVIGLTATPYRNGLGSLTEGDIFDEISCDYCSFEKFNSLLDDGYLCPLIPKKTKCELSVEGVKVTAGDYNQKDLQESCDKDVVTRAACKEAVSLAHDRNHWLVFTTSISHAEHTCEILNEYGVSARVVHGKLSKEDRKRNIEEFKAGLYKAMVGVDVFTTGFNYKAVDCIVVLRPTMSASKHVQLLGRGTRPSPETGKVNTLVLDFAANTKRLGPINDPVIPRKRGKGKAGMAPFKLCPFCSCYNHTRARVCVSCLFEFPEVFNGKSQASELELIRREPKVKKEKPVVELIIHDVSRTDLSPSKSLTIVDSRYSPNGCALNTLLRSLDTRLMKLGESCQAERLYQLRLRKR
jgi:DNA repair protein RadD